MNTVDDYIASLDEPKRAELERVRRIIKLAVPEVEESISYGMPTMKYKDKTLILFAAFKNHMSLFGDVNVVKSQLEGEGYKFSDKGTLQFTIEKPLPENAIKEIVLEQYLKIVKQRL